MAYRVANRQTRKCQPDTEWEVVLDPPMSASPVIQDLSGSKKQLAPIVHDEGVRPIISR